MGIVQVIYINEFFVIEKTITKHFFSFFFKGIHEENLRQQGMRIKVRKK